MNIRNYVPLLEDFTSEELDEVLAFIFKKLADKGCGCGGALLQTNGNDNPDQSILNLIQGDGVAITEEYGSITISATPTEPVASVIAIVDYTTTPYEVTNEDHIVFSGSGTDAPTVLISGASIGKKIIISDGDGKADTYHISIDADSDEFVEVSGSIINVNSVYQSVEIQKITSDKWKIINYENYSSTH